MKNNTIYLSLLLALFLANCTPKVGDQAKKTMEDATSTVMVGKEDFRKSVPAAGPPPKIQVGSYEQFQLDNGLKVIVVENHKLPRVSYQLFVNAPDIMQNEKAGFIDMAGDLLSKGTSNRSKAEIDESIDFMGASLSTSASGMFASSLTKHSENLMEIMSDVLLNPTFPEEEFEKSKKQTLSGLAQAKEDPSSIADNVSTVLRYGKDHPYGEITTETTIENISREDCKDYYETFFRPNISYLIVVGDVTTATTKLMVEKHFGAWKSSNNIPKVDFPTPAAPDKTTVDFVNKTGAVQSVIALTYPVDLKPGHPDVIKSRVMNTMLGGFFQSRLNQNLRETNAYTYGASSRLRNNEKVGSFRAGASVRNEVTDSSVAELVFELNRIRDELIDQADLDMVKNVIAGSFARSLERPETVAQFALNTARYNLPSDYYATYLEKLDKVTLSDVQMMAKKYVRPDNAHIVVVGNRDEVAENLGQFAQSGEVDFYDTYGNQIKEETPLPDGLTAQTVIKDYLNAIGTSAKLKTVKKLHQKMGMSVQGMNIVMEVYQKSPNKFAMAQMMGPNVVMKQTFDGTTGKMSGMQGNKTLEGAELDELKERASIFPEMTYDEKGFKIELKGIEEVEGKKAYKIVIESPSGKKSTDYFAMENSLKIRSVSADGSTVDLGEYKAVNGILFPHNFSMTMPGAPMKMNMAVEKIEVNGDFAETVFQ